MANLKHVVLFVLATLLITGCSAVDTFYNETLLGQNSVAPAGDFRLREQQVPRIKHT